MPQKSKIEWTENTWNPVTGCDKISAGCLNCYAERMANRLQKMGNEKYAEGFQLRLHPGCLGDPYKIKKPSRIFVNSMSDLFHKDVPLEYIKQVFEVMNNTPIHTYQVLTKRADILAMYASELVWTPNIWMGVTIENKDSVFRMDCLRRVPANIRFISFEPLLENPGELNFEGIDWAIVGGESGWHARPIEEVWIEDIQKQCEQQGTMFYFKQWGGTNKKKSGRLLQGQTWDAMPSFG